MSEKDDFQVIDGDDPSSEESSSPPSKPVKSSRSVPRKTSSSPPQIQTQIREAVTPYFPPPVVQAIHRIDPQLEPYVGPEASVTLVGTVILSWLVLALIRAIFSRTSGRSSAIHDDDDDQGLKGQAGGSSGGAENQYDATVLLCGPRNGGKTCLFYHLSLGVQDLPTVTSIKANVAVSNNKPMTNNSTSSSDNVDSKLLPRIRYVDWPGHAPLNDSVLQQSVWNKASTTKPKDANALRIVLVLDATQPVAAAAESLYEIWSSAQKSQTQRTVFCACHKKDLTKAKNSKRIKIQMRTELQRILSVQKPSWWTTTTSNDSAAGDKQLDLNALPYCKLHFASTSSLSSNASEQQQQQAGMDQLAEFCQTGQLPSKES